jgi:hypothetical protein
LPARGNARWRGQEERGSPSRPSPALVAQRPSPTSTFWPLAGPPVCSPVSSAALCRVRVRCTHL